MAEVHKFATNVYDPDAAQQTPAPRRQAHGTVRTLSFAAAIANGDSANSTYLMGRIPSNARIDKRSLLRCSAITGVTDADLGFDNSLTALMNAQTLAAAADVDIGPALADMHKQAWELAGLTKDPNEMLDLVLTINAAATADGTVALDLLYITD